MAFSIFQYKSTKISAEHSNDIKNKLNAIYHYLPKTKQERFWFILLSISAGICEEIIFRLFLFEFCREHTMLGFAFIIPNIIFALTHIGSGISNLIIAFILGLLFSVIYYFTQNIWLAVLLHIAIDINTGLLAYNVEQIQKQSNIPL
ncbi:CPBP family intramembrane glutamic endopeptidase [Formosa sp. A9]|uniref:CPBP family intramembrane glutamic endopeptidase n=1 Tax=Formosa sp. A9 TaxID=3442641 RepID=UPI003EB75592